LDLSIIIIRIVTYFAAISWYNKMCLLSTINVISKNTASYKPVMTIFIVGNNSNSRDIIQASDIE